MNNKKNISLFEEFEDFDNPEDQHPKKGKDSYRPEYYLAGIKQECRQAKHKCREDANFTCQICGKSEKDDGILTLGHHIKDLSIENEDNSQDNLICLCFGCHNKVHHHQYEIEYGTKRITVLKKAFEKISLFD